MRNRFDNICYFEEMDNVVCIYNNYKFCILNDKDIPLNLLSLYQLL